MGATYSVNVEKVRKIQKSINAAIFAGNKKALVGHYAGIVPFAGKKLAMHTDGVGTKVLVADELGVYDTVGIDAIAMNVNDIICIGARPLAGVDYLAVANEDEYLISEIMKGLVKGAKEAGIMIVGGETAIMKDVIHGKNRPFDLAFTALGVVEKYTTGSAIRCGDVLIGLESSGLHSNGYTLARKVLGIKKWGKAMLTPTRIYVKPVMEMLHKCNVHGLAHITGGAFSKLTRLNKKLGFFIDNPAKPAPIFNALWNAVEDEVHMYRTFNMGTGMVVVVPAREENEVVRIARKHSVKAQAIGSVIREPGVYLADGARLDYKI
ncbi:MAG: phosphoribosylformylglycinamidine cyclo-ligase [Candidatus Bilamarchaeaceae archaeon]